MANINQNERCYELEIFIRGRKSPIHAYYITDKSGPILDMTKQVGVDSAIQGGIRVREITLENLIKETKRSNYRSSTNRIF